MKEYDEPKAKRLNAQMENRRSGGKELKVIGQVRVEISAGQRMTIKKINSHLGVTKSGWKVSAGP